MESVEVGFLHPSWRDFLQLLSAALVPIVAIAGVGVAISNLYLQRQRRRDELFDRRLDLFCRYYEAMGYTDLEMKKYNMNTLTVEEALEIANRIHGRLYRISAEAEFLFDREISTDISRFSDSIGGFISQLQQYVGQGSDVLPEEYELPVKENLFAPFRKYLRLAS